MRTMQLQPACHIDAIVFDCDGTLTRLEGIDELAAINKVKNRVARMTEAAMSRGEFNQAIYHERLMLTRPTVGQLDQLGERYFEDRVPDIEAVIALIKRLGKQVYIVSAGLKQAILPFANRLGIKADAVFAVELTFDRNGNYLDFDRQSPLVEMDGKYRVVKQLQERYPSILHVGDGMNDCSTKKLVTRFIGYGGIFYRKKLAKSCDFYISTPSMAAILPLTLRADELNQLNEQDWKLYNTGMIDYLCSSDGGGRIFRV